MASLGGNTAVIITKRRQGTGSIWQKCFNKMKTCLILTLIIRNEKTIVLYLQINSIKLLSLIDLTYFSFLTRSKSSFYSILQLFCCFFTNPGPTTYPRAQRSVGQYEEKEKTRMSSSGDTYNVRATQDKAWQRVFLRCI